MSERNRMILDMSKKLDEDIMRVIMLNLDVMRGGGMSTHEASAACIASVGAIAAHLVGMHLILVPHADREVAFDRIVGELNRALVGTKADLIAKVNSHITSIEVGRHG